MNCNKKIVKQIIQLIYVNKIIQKLNNQEYNKNNQEYNKNLRIKNQIH